MAVRFFVGASCIVDAAAHGEAHCFFDNMKTGKEYVSLTANVSYYTTQNSNVQIPSEDLLDVAMPMPQELAVDCPSNMKANEWCVALGALAKQWPGYSRKQFHTHGSLSGNHTITSVEPGPQGFETIACHHFTDGYYCHTAMQKLVSTYSVLADNGAVGFGVMCHGKEKCHLLGDEDVILSPSIDLAGIPPQPQRTKRRGIAPTLPPAPPPAPMVGIPCHCCNGVNVFTGDPCDVVIDTRLVV